ncbi:Pantothenate kinase CAB1 [Yarrowia sp. B02]|nr:Pantothenate kinase CAB1 [Yarrowia sp. B02]
MQQATQELKDITSRDPRASALKFLHAGDIQINVEGAFIVHKDQNGRETPPDTRDIVLPHHTAHVSHIAIDIGGSLAKIVYFSHDEPNGDSLEDVGGRLNFTVFETDKIDDMIDFLKGLMSRLQDNHRRSSRSERHTPDGSSIRSSSHDSIATSPSKPQSSNMRIMATGGGAYKFYERLRDELGADISREDEMECLIAGLDFFITEIPEEVFCYSETNPMVFAEPRQPSIYPYLLVNIGSGVSMIKVLGPQQFVRIGGSSLGGGTLWGLLSLLTDATSYDEMLAKAAEGDNSNVDMLVGDIYGQDYTKIGLKATTIASSFGRVFKEIQRDREAGEEEDKASEASSTDSASSHAPKSSRDLFKSEDISRSLLYAISNNIGQIAFLQAQIHNLQHIYFGGSYIRGHLQTMHTLSYAINFWSQGSKQAYFLRHEGYLGAVGAFIKKQPSGWGRRNSAGELERFVQ